MPIVTARQRGAQRLEASMPAHATGCCSITFSRRMCGAVLVVTVVGTIDVTNAPRFDDRLQEILRAGNLYGLVIDLSRVELLRAAGLQCLVRAQDTGDKRGIQIRLVLGEGVAKRVIEVRGNRGLPRTSPLVDDACQFGSEGLAGDPTRGTWPRLWGR
jgi:anti-anti-sigma factor